MEQKYQTITLICVHTSNEKALELVDYYTLNGEIVLLSCLNILDKLALEKEDYLNMDREKINISDRVIIHGVIQASDTYVNSLIEYGKSLGKEIQYVNNN